ncbi:hypothetical protein PC118_g18521 [Phytophthora cactorum]|uniref:Uncharacterized protein n=1 Tax=Phytophthora cactorum TaxID=29920 RepID=A0A329RIZ9_9STRA|nr:hypothetical protein PC118_g18521 [Phytophthora cactorum]RAW24577.1 hypothetical protein PC110_g18994 [Phytophthora cactorum]
MYHLIALVTAPCLRIASLITAATISLPRFMCLSGSSSNAFAKFASSSA